MASEVLAVTAEIRASSLFGAMAATAALEVPVPAGCPVKMAQRLAPPAEMDSPAVTAVPVATVGPAVGYSAPVATAASEVPVAAAVTGGKDDPAKSVQSPVPMAETVDQAETVPTAVPQATVETPGKGASCCCGIPPVLMDQAALVVEEVTPEPLVLEVRVLRVTPRARTVVTAAAAETPVRQDRAASAAVWELVVTAETEE